MGNPCGELAQKLHTHTHTHSGASGSALPPMTVSGGTTTSSVLPLPSFSSQTSLGSSAGMLPGVKTVNQGLSKPLPGAKSLPGISGGPLTGPLQAMQSGSGSGLQVLQPQPSTHPLSSSQAMSGGGGGSSMSSLHSSSVLNSNSMANAAGAGYLVRTPNMPGPKTDSKRPGEAQLKETDALEYLNQVKQQRVGLFRSLVGLFLGLS
jgi:hypothetical protein